MSHVALIHETARQVQESSGEQLVMLATVSGHVWLKYVTLLFYNLH